MHDGYYCLQSTGSFRWHRHDRCTIVILVLMLVVSKLISFQQCLIGPCRTCCPASSQRHCNLVTYAAAYYSNCVVSSRIVRHEQFQDNHLTTASLVSFVLVVVVVVDYLDVTVLIETMVVSGEKMCPTLRRPSASPSRIEQLLPRRKSHLCPNLLVVVGIQLCFYFSSLCQRWCPVNRNRRFVSIFFLMWLCGRQQRVVCSMKKVFTLFLVVPSATAGSKNIIFLSNCQLSFSFLRLFHQRRFALHLLLTERLVVRVEKGCLTPSTLNVFDPIGWLRNLNVGFLTPAFVVARVAPVCPAGRIER